MKTGFMLLLCAAASALAQPSGAGPPTGTFTATGAMTIARYGHTATLLNNGKVLIAGGGLRFDLPMANAELYDPTSGTFTLTGFMNTARSFHIASLLPDGRVLIAGGDSGSGENIVRGLTTTEVYDPSTGTFTAAGDMIHGHECARATVLNNGKVLLYGGSPVSSDYPASDAELYDPATSSFAAAGTYAIGPPRSSFCAGVASTLLADGRVLIVWEDDLAEIYDPEANSFTQTGKPLGPSYNLSLATATLLMDGRVLVGGGDDGSDNYKSTEIFVPTGSFAPGGSMSAAHDTGSATLLPNGTVLIAGGFEPIGSERGTDVYDPVSGIFHAGPEMVTGRFFHTATLLNDGSVLMAGGHFSPSEFDTTSLAELYRPDVLTPAPVLLSLTGDGTGAGAILHAGSQQVVSPNNPAVAGEALEIFGTGLIDGSVIPPQVAIGGRMAEVLFFGKAPGFAGLNQINVRVPTGVAPGQAVPVRLNYLGRPSNEVTIALK